MECHLSRVVVDVKGGLAATLKRLLPDMRPATLKDHLRQGVVLNGAVVHRHDTPLDVGDILELGPKAIAAAQHAAHINPRGNPRGDPRGDPRGGSSGDPTGGPSRPRSGAPGDDEVTLLHVDQDLVVAYKPAGLLTVGTGAGAGTGTGTSTRKGRGGTSENTLLKAVTPLVASRADPRPRLFPCHRLDKETSGLLLLPRTRELQGWFFANWSTVEKRYLAVVEGTLRDLADEGSFDDALLPPDAAFNVRIAPANHPEALPARTRYRIVERARRRSLLELTLDSGRQHQIRVHLSHHGSPIVGDVRYGNGARAPRMCLHAWRLAFTHPATSTSMVFERPAPTTMLGQLT